MSQRILKAVFSLLLPLALVACGGSAGTGSPETAAAPDADGPSFVIDNSRSAASSLTVFLIPEGRGSRIRLGNVRLGERKALRPRTTIGSTRLRLVAQETGGRERISQAFTITPRSIVEWEVSRNRITVSRGG